LENYPLKSVESPFINFNASLTFAMSIMTNELHPGKMKKLKTIIGIAFLTLSIGSVWA